MTAWERARELVAACLPNLPRGRYKAFGERYFFDGKLEHFRYSILSGEEDALRVLVTVIFEIEGGARPSGDRFLGLALASGSRILFLFEDALYDEPLPGNRTYPTFFYRWEREKIGEVAHLRFFRIDFSDDDFINYEGVDLCETLSEGNPEAFLGLPKSLAEESEILGMPVRKYVNLEECAKRILEQSELEAFTNVCRARKT